VDFLSLLVKKLLKREEDERAVKMIEALFLQYIE
jgi:hypothetical protein